MDPAKVSFLFGEVPDGFDIEDPDDRAELVELDGDEPLATARSAVRAIVAEQVVSDNPPAVWTTAQRLLALGMDRREVLRNLTLAFEHAAFTALKDEDEDGPETDRYAAALADLPLPTAEAVEAAALTAVRSAPTAALSDLDERVHELLGRPAPGPLGQVMVDRVIDRMLDEGPLALLPGDRVVDVPALTAGIVLTHRISHSERELDVLDGGFDLAGFSRHQELRLPDGATIAVVSAGRGNFGWQGPPGWLNRFGEGDLLAVTVDGDGVVRIATLDNEPGPDPQLVDLVRAVYDDEVAEPWLPVPAEDLVLGVLGRDPEAFSRPRPPLATLCDALGLERRMTEVAHDESVWEAQRSLWRLHGAFDALEDQDQRRAAGRVLQVAEADEPSRADVRNAFDDLADPDVAEVVLDELCDDGLAGRLSERLLEAATTPAQIGAARWVAALVAEREGEPLVADAHLRLALEADPSSTNIVERCAWYASDKGDAAEAVRLWRQLPRRRYDDLDTVEPFTRRSGPKLGRNDRCWCGSGRKFKACHNGRQPSPPLPERVGWLCRKATAYLEHSGREARDEIVMLAECRAVDPDEGAIVQALDDPIVIDAALTEGGWFERFVEDRGALLPDDEALLAQSWLLVPRTVYEVVTTAPGVGLQVRDLRTGDILEVRERTFSRDARPASFVCGRAVPDGETHQFVGGLFPVAPGTEGDVLDLCDEADPAAICEHVASLHRPPALKTREGEPLVACEAVLMVPDAAEAAAALDARYERDGDAWVEMHALHVDERILRATLTLDGSRLTVTTHSEARVERVLDVLLDALPGARVVSDERVPVDTGKLPSPPPFAPPEITLDPDIVGELQDRFERRWIDESVPALAGLTPRQASQDPTRRDELRRLIASFPSGDDLPVGSVTMRPARLRELLDM
jgi:hypothetical protein